MYNSYRLIIIPHMVNEKNTPDMTEKDSHHDLQLWKSVSGFSPWNLIWYNEFMTISRTIKTVCVRFFQNYWIFFKKHKLKFQPKIFFNIRYSFPKRAKSNAIFRKFYIPILSLALYLLHQDCWGQSNWTKTSCILWRC
jgi:hypothetical protein